MVNIKSVIATVAESVEVQSDNSTGLRIYPAIIPGLDSLRHSQHIAEE